MVSLILPFHRDSARLSVALHLITEYRERNSTISEVILAHNGGDEIPKLKLPSFCKLLHTDSPGIGAGYALGIEAANAPWVLLSASDLPFGFSDLEFALRLGLGREILIGSKLHPESSMSRYDDTRLVFSRTFYAWRRLLLGAKTPKDSQGTILLERKMAQALLPAIQSRDFFFSVELIYRAQKFGMPIREVPVTYRGCPDKSSVDLFADGISFFYQTARMRFGR